MTTTVTNDSAAKSGSVPGRRVAVVGAGLGGLSAAVSLAAAGFQVDVFEKNDRVGGKLNVHSQDGFSFDLGPSILTLPHIFRELFARAGRRLRTTSPCVRSDRTGGTFSRMAG